MSLSKETFTNNYLWKGFSMDKKNSKKGLLKKKEATPFLDENPSLYSGFIDLLKQFNEGEQKSVPEEVKTAIRQQIMYDLENIYLQAKALGHLPCALKAKELQGKHFGMFGLEKQNSNQGIPVKPLTKMSLEDLRYIISSTCDELGLEDSSYLDESSTK